jgi:hypothetical protein
MTPPKGKKSKHVSKKSPAERNQELTQTVQLTDLLMKQETTKFLKPLGKLHHAIQLVEQQLKHPKPNWRNGNLTMALSL